MSGLLIIFLVCVACLLLSRTGRGCLFRFAGLFLMVFICVLIIIAGGIYVLLAP